MRITSATLCHIQAIQSCHLIPHQHCHKQSVLWGQSFPHLTPLRRLVQCIMSCLLINKPLHIRQCWVNIHTQIHNVTHHIHTHTHNTKHTHTHTAFICHLGFVPEIGLDTENESTSSWKTFGAKRQLHSPCSQRMRTFTAYAYIHSIHTLYITRVVHSVTHTHTHTQTSLLQQRPLVTKTNCDNPCKEATFSGHAYHVYGSRLLTFPQKSYTTMSSLWACQ